MSLKMDSQFADEECCLNCKKSLDSLQKWYYLDNYGNQQGPFDSFLILYYIYSGYFEDTSVFFLYDKANGGPSNFNTLNNYADKIVQDVRAHASNIFTCVHFMENFGSSEDGFNKFDEIQMPEGITKVRENEEHLVSTENMYASVNSPNSSKEFTNLPDENQDKEQIGGLSNNAILKKRVADNLKQADAHLNRVNSRRLCHLLSKNLSTE